MLIEDDFRKAQQEADPAIRRVSVLNLAARIRSGETTGDKLDDFIIATMHTVEEDNSKLYHKVYERLSENGIVLIVNLQKSYLSFPAIIAADNAPPESVYIRTAFYLTKLSIAPILDIKSGQFIITTAAFARSVDFKPWDLVEENLHINGWDIVLINGNNKNRQHCIVFGDEIYACNKLPRSFLEKGLSIIGYEK